MNYEYWLDISVVLALIAYSNVALNYLLVQYVIKINYNILLYFFPSGSVCYKKVKTINIVNCMFTKNAYEIS